MSILGGYFAIFIVQLGWRWLIANRHYPFFAQTDVHAHESKLMQSFQLRLLPHARRQKHSVSDVYLPTYIRGSLWAWSALWRQSFGPPPTFFCKRLFLGSTRSSQSEELSVAHVWLALLNSREGAEACVYNDKVKSRICCWHQFIYIQMICWVLQTYFVMILTPRMPYLSHMVQPHRKSISKLWLRMMMTCSLPNLSTVAWSVYRVHSVPDHHSSSITSSAHRRQHIMCIRKELTTLHMFQVLNMRTVLPVQSILCMLHIIYTQQPAHSAAIWSICRSLFWSKCQVCLSSSAFIDPHKQSLAAKRLKNPTVHSQPSKLDKVIVALD